MRQLDALRAKLREAFNPALIRAEDWTDMAATRRMLERVRQRHDGLGQPPDQASIASALAYFRRTGQPDGWRGLKRVCYGAGYHDESGWCVLSDRQSRDRLFALAQGQKEARKRVKCFQALLSAYWSFPLASADEKSKMGWLDLRKWLDSRLPSVAQDVDRIPGWLSALMTNRNLLHDDPCARYGAKLLAGDGSEFNAVVKALGIPSNSWVHHEVVVAQMRAGAALGHDGFKARLLGLLEVATGKAGLDLPESLQRKCVAILISRYAKLPDRQEHTTLLDAALKFIGDPQHRPASWDAFVVDEYGRPDDDAREMINRWLKRGLIKDFFTLLSEDGVGDGRRLDYWLRFEDLITDMWFALGANARARKGAQFEDFRNRAKGRLLNLVGTTPDNNAFIMRLGNYVAVEFGETGNALYVYRWDGLPPEVSQILLAWMEHAEVTIHQLKSQKHTEMIKTHVDSPAAMKSWEQKFDAAICPLLGQKPKGRPALVPELEAIIKRYHVMVEDRRPQGGALWVFVDDSHPVLNKQVQELGFRYRPSKGWYREN